MNDIEELELKIAKFLRSGVILAGVVIAIGLGLNFKSDANPFSAFRYHSQVEFMDLLEVYFMDENWGGLISFLGLFILISLPVLRVFLTAIIFLKEKEFLLASLAALVLSGLILSFSLGIEL